MTQDFDVIVIGGGHAGYEAAAAAARARTRKNLGFCCAPRRICGRK